MATVFPQPPDESGPVEHPPTKRRCERCGDVTGVVCVAIDARPPLSGEPPDAVFAGSLILCRRCLGRFTLALNEWMRQP